MPWTRFNLPDEARRIVSTAPSLTLARNINELVELAVRDADHGWHEVSYDVPGRGLWFLQVETQPEVGEEGYDRGAEMLYEFFEQQLAKFDEPDLDPLGKRIIEACLNRASMETYSELTHGLPT